MIPLTTDLFDYTLPPHLIAQTPSERRDHSRLLVVDRSAHSVAHHQFSDLPKFLRSTDVLFRNNVAVLPARLRAIRPSGGQVECFLLSTAHDPMVWRCLLKPGKKLPVSATFRHPAGAFEGRILEKYPDGSAIVQFTTPSGESIASVANRFGEVPLPPYIDRGTANEVSPSRRQSDLDRYQTVYADPAKQVAVAAPTAGLHFTPELLSELERLGVKTADVTLHVGLGTFQPITADRIADHAIHRELYEIPAATQDLLPRRPNGRRIAVGTTTVRTIEDFLARDFSRITTGGPFVGEAAIFIYPPRLFRGVDALITNFHQPRSTLLCLVSAFLSPGSLDGINWLKDIYAEAISHEYRFFSYGDAMLIL